MPYKWNAGKSHATGKYFVCSMSDALRNQTRRYDEGGQLECLRSQHNELVEIMGRFLDVLAEERICLLRHSGITSFRGITTSIPGTTTVGRSGRTTRKSPPRKTKATPDTGRRPKTSVDIEYKGAYN